MNLGLSVAEAMTKRPVAIPRNLTVASAAQVMRDKNVGSLLVVEDDVLYGILTQVDMIDKVMAEGRNPKDVAVEELMTTQLITLEPDTDILRAIQIMIEHNIRHIPITEGKQLEGFLTMTDVLKFEPQLIEILNEAVQIQGSSGRLALRSSDVTTEGFCEVCGNYASDLKQTDDNKLTCSNCRE